MKPKRRDTPTPAVDRNGVLALQIDGSGRAAYLTVTKRRIARTLEVEDCVLVDFDAHGRIVGIEVIGLARGRLRRVLGRLRRRYAAEVPALDLLSSLGV